MRIFLPVCFILAFNVYSQAQNLNGQWRGGFLSKDNFWGGDTEYVLDIEITGSTVGGLSYSYFIIGGKRCYVICKLEGKYDKESRSISVTEVNKVKSNTPPDFKDCLQTHYLTFMKQGESEYLRGRWKGARPNDNCGSGETELERKVLVKVAPKKETKEQPVVKAPAKSIPAPSTAQVTDKKKTTPAKQTPPSSNPQGSVSRSTEHTAKPATIDNDLPRPEKQQIQTTVQAPIYSKFEARSKQLIKTVDVPLASFRVDLYDNGQVDGDTISVFYNGKMVVEKQRLSTTPISIQIDIDPTRKDNDLVMYAENLGSIPPNTALMVVTVGDIRHEVNITSTEQTSGTVRFRLKQE